MSDTTHRSPADSPQGTTEHIVLYDGYTVSADFYNSVRLQVDNVIPALERDRKYTLAMLCGPEFWDCLSNGERRMAGRCMAHLVACKRLPLRFAESRHEYPKYYWLI